MIVFESGLVSNGILSLNDEEPNLMNTNELLVFDSSSSKLTKSFFKGHEIHDLTDLFFNRMEINLPASILQDKLWKK